MAARQIKTHVKVRKLQRTLYLQAKTKPKWRAWSLYADLCREVFIEEAMHRVLENKGKSGIDGYTVEQMKLEWNEFRDSLKLELLEKSYKPSPVKRVLIAKPDGGVRKLGIPTVKDRVVQTILKLLIEPIFEADFHDESYGYRLQKRAQDAVDSIGKGIYNGMTVAIEADLSRYFDTIDHGRLMKLVSKRVSDGSILSLIKQFLRVPIVEVESGGKKRVIPNKKGVPQGGVISPLLANLFLDKLDHALNNLSPGDVKMIRYADDFVILVREGIEGIIYDRVKDWLENAGLTLNQLKTKITDTRKKGRPVFLGFELGEQRSIITGGRYIHTRPSKQACQSYRDKIRAELNRSTTWRSHQSAIYKVNQITRGWAGYFHFGNSTNSFGSLNFWLYERVRRWLCTKHRIRSRCNHEVFPNQRIRDLGLELLPTRAVEWS